jgi:hypothetical protein
LFVVKSGSAVAAPRRTQSPLSWRGDRAHGESPVRATARGIYAWHAACTLFSGVWTPKELRASQPLNTFPLSARSQEMKARKTMIAIAIAALIPLGAAVAGDQYGDKDKMGSSSFKKLDTNKDGKISQAEAAVDSTIVFSTADANGDGYLDSDEWKANAKSGSSKPQSSPSPDSSMPESTEPTGEPAPDTETPRQ